MSSGAAPRWCDQCHRLEHESALGSDAFQSDRSAEIIWDVPLHQLEHGHDLLTLEVALPGDGTRKANVAQRHARFEVR